MAVVRVPSGAVLRLVLQTGVDAQGNPVYRNRNLTNLRTDAQDQDLFDVAQALAGLQEYALSAIHHIKNDRLIQA